MELNFFAGHLPSGQFDIDQFGQLGSAKCNSLNLQHLQR
jgi:hypothetical protein